MIHTVKGFAIVNKAEIDVSLELSCFFDDPVEVVNLISGSSYFNTNFTSQSYKYTRKKHYLSGSQNASNIQTLEFL